MSELHKWIKSKLVAVSYMFRKTVEFPTLKVTLYSTSLCTSVMLKKRERIMNPWTIRSKQHNAYKNVIQGRERERKWRMGGRKEGWKEKKRQEGEEEVVKIWLCSSRKYPYSPPPLQKGLEFPGGWAFCRTKNLKKCMKYNCNFHRGWGGGSLKKSLLWGSYGYSLELHIATV